MRGKIIQYNGNDGSGLISADGRQLDFSIRQWRGDIVPTVNRVVEIVFDGEAVASVTAISEEALLREKAMELKEKLGGAGNLLGAGGSDLGKNVLAQLGIPLAVAYGVFFLASLAINFGTVKTMGVSVSTSLYDLVAHFSQMGKGSYQILLFGAYLSFLVPVFWKHRFAPLATLFPAAMLLVFLTALYGDYSTANQTYMAQMSQVGSLFGGRGMGSAKPLYNAFSDFFSFGLGFYVSLVTAGFAGWLGVRKFLVS